MAECHNFFHTSAPSSSPARVSALHTGDGHPSSSSSSPPPPPPHDGLELSLTLSLSTSTSTSTSCSSSSSSSSSFSSSSALAERSNSSEKPSTMAGFSMPSRDQVWQNLQRNGAVCGEDQLGQIVDNSNNRMNMRDIRCNSSVSGASAPKPMTWPARRSASVQVIMPVSDGGGAAAAPSGRQPIRSLSCSNGGSPLLHHNWHHSQAPPPPAPAPAPVPPAHHHLNLHHQQRSMPCLNSPFADLGSLLIRSASSVQSSRPRESGRGGGGNPQQQQQQIEDEEVRRRKEIATQRRQEARKRRRSLMEEKQMKKARLQSCGSGGGGGAGSLKRISSGSSSSSKQGAGSPEEKETEKETEKEKEKERDRERDRDAERERSLPCAGAGAGASMAMAVAVAVAVAVASSSPPESSSNPSSSSSSSTTTTTSSSVKHGEEEGNHHGGGKDHHHHQQQQQQQQHPQKVSEASSSPKLRVDESAQEAGKEKPSFLLPPLHRAGAGAGATTTTTTMTTMDIMKTLPPGNLMKRQRSWPGPPASSRVLPPRHSWQQHSDDSIPPPLNAAPSCKAHAKTGGPEQQAGNQPVAPQHELSPTMSLPANAAGENGRQKNGDSSSSSSSWRRVTTTGRGPNGKTIFGFMYITTSHHHVPQVWLVCNCHGKHMSPLEFVEHSGSSDLSNPERNIVVNSLPFFPQLATTPV